jgi:histidine ammonia-lyase
MLLLDGNSLTIADVAAVADGVRTVTLAPAARNRMRTTRAIVEGIAARGEVVYGVTTGFGKLSDIAIAPDQLAQLQVNLVRSHAAGVGPRRPLLRGPLDLAAGLAGHAVRTR